VLVALLNHLVIQPIGTRFLTGRGRPRPPAFWNQTIDFYHRRRRCCPNCPKWWVVAFIHPYSAPKLGLLSSSQEAQWPSSSVISSVVVPARTPLASARVTKTRVNQTVSPGLFRFLARQSELPPQSGPLSGPSSAHRRPEPSLQRSLCCCGCHSKLPSRPATGTNAR
jgi:hypothetical protein